MRKDSTLSYFDQRRPDNMERLLPVVPTAPHRVPVGTLSWGSRDSPASWAEFAQEVVDSLPPDAVFFLDASFLHRQEIPGEVIDALMSRRIAITQLIWGELQDWVRNPFANARFRDVLVNARANGNPSVIFFDPSEFPEDVHESIRYYVSLLLARKYIGVSLKKSHTNSGERELSVEELVSRIQSRVGDRGALLARKGLEDHGKPNFGADEDLVVTAIAYAIVTGYATCILTRDRDPLEQFRKFIYLLDTHYRSSLIGESFLDTPENFIKSDGFAETPRDCFEGGERCVLDLPRRFTEWVLPRRSCPVDVRCDRFAGNDARMRIASLEFCAQREMLKLLQIKGKSGGRNYPFPDGRNCHLAISPPFISQMNGKVIVGRDRTIEFGPFSGPIVDVEYALQEVQRFSRSIVDESESVTTGGTPGMKLADFFLPERLAFSSPPDWRSLEWTELSRAIQFFDAAALFCVDRGVMPRLRTDARQALIARRFGWSTSIRDSTLAAESSKVLTVGERRALNEMIAFDLRQHAPYEYGFGHYLALLGLRRQFATVIRQRLNKEYGRDCKDGEVGAIAEHYGGIRARRLAEQGELPHYDPLLFAGDELLVYGAITGVVKGADIVFLTEDPLFMDQFLKLGCLWGSDYIASQFGRRYGGVPSAFPTFDARESSPNPITTIFGRAQLCNLRSGWHEKILPHNPFLINLHCWLLGRDDGDSVRFAALTFCAERGMHNLLRVKGATGGRNVEGLDGRNLRAVFDVNGEAVVTIWNDRMIPIGALDFPEDDRLELRVPSLAAADISRIHMNEGPFAVPWHEAAS